MSRSNARQTPSSSTSNKGGRGIKSTDPKKGISTNIKTSEYDELRRIAEDNHVTVNSLIAFFVRHSMQLHREGKLKIPTVTPTIRQIQMP